MVGIVGLSVVVDLWWLHHFRSGFPVDIDESRYLEFGLKLFDALGHGGLPPFWHAWSAQHDFGPLLPLTSVPVYAVLGESLTNGLVTQLVFFVVLIVSSYGVGMRLSSRAGGALVALLVATTPAVIDFSRSYQFAITAAAILTACTYALLSSEALTRRSWSVLWGVLLGLTPLARTMMIAFMPAQIVAAAWLIISRRGARKPRVANLAIGLLVSIITATAWIGTSWHAVLNYLTSFGYGSQSAHFSRSGTRLTVGYWTRELVSAVRADFYVPLAALLILCLLVGLVAWLIQRNQRRGPGAGRISLRTWASSDAAVVLFVLLEGYLAVTSSRNEGVGFRVPLIPAVLGVVVCVLWRLPWQAARRVIISCLIVVSALNFVMKADVTTVLSGNQTATLPGVGTVPVLLGTGYIQGYVLGSQDAEYVSATRPLSESQTRWLPAYAQIVTGILRLGHQGHFAGRVDLATDEPLLNANDLALAARLHFDQDLVVHLLPGPSGYATLGSYARLLTTNSAPLSPVGGPATSNVLITVTRVGLSYFGLTGLKDVNQGLLERAARTVGFACVDGIALPDGRVAIVQWRPPAHTSTSPDVPSPGGCSPRVERISPANGSAGVPTTAPISAVFSEPMDNGSLTRAVTLVRAKDSRRVGGTVSSFGDLALVFRPDRPLPHRMQFTATITMAASAATGATLTTTKRWSFTTN